MSPRLAAQLSVNKRRVDFCSLPYYNKRNVFTQQTIRVGLWEKRHFSTKCRITLLKFYEKTVKVPMGRVKEGQSMEQTDDRRVRKTRRLLREQLARLMEHKSVREITVTELCRACDINRGTFYRHYADVYDLLHSVEEEIRRGFQQVMDPVFSGGKLGEQVIGPGLQAAFCYLAENADMCRVLLCRGGDMEFVQQVENLMREFVREQYRKVNRREGEMYDYIFTYIAAGCIGVLRQWLEQDMPQPPQQIAALLEQIMREGVLALL